MNLKKNVFNSIIRDNSRIFIKFNNEIPIILKKYEFDDCAENSIIIKIIFFSLIKNNNGIVYEISNIIYNKINHFLIYKHHILCDSSYDILKNHNSDTFGYHFEVKIKKMLKEIFLLESSIEIKNYKTGSGIKTYGMYSIDLYYNNLKGFEMEVSKSSAKYFLHNEEAFYIYFSHY